MRFGPPVRFTRNRDGAHLAYQVVGEGDLDLVFLFGWPSHLALMWEHPAFAGFLHRLASFSRLILFDRAGNGMSDRGPTGHAFEDGMDEVGSVLAAVGSERAAFFGCHLGGRLALLLAATYPEQVSAVVTFGSHPATLRDADYPWGSTPQQREQLLAAFRDGTLDTDGLLAMIAPGDATDAAMRRWWATFFYSAASRVESADEITALGPVDIRGLLGSVRVPTLVLHRTGDRLADVHASRYMAQRLPQARLRELPGEDHFPFLGDQDAVVALTQEFLTGTLPVAEPDRVLATVWFTDIVDSTRLATQLGDRRWHRVLQEHNAVVRATLARFRGREVKTTGDGFLATFDGPARAIRAADAIRAELADAGLQIRVGLHTGECELLGEDIGGIAVHLAARVLGQA
ncbi:MAG TPA: adenylate/guanylate cyclase domain-containing protein, partial [Actinomycetes bacterium]|nr:adenylate/guanylate cyclase domain-containing protein [Actinomycetes bacterium]